MADELVKLRTGTITAAEKQFIQEHIRELGYEEVAKRLNRKPETILRFARQWGLAESKNAKDAEVFRANMGKQLKDSPEWTALKTEFLDVELDYFSHRYGKLAVQFGPEIPATEETQIFQLIKFEILMNRNLKGAKRAVADIRRLEKELTDLYAQYEGSTMPDTAKNMAVALENQLLSARAAQNSKSTEFVKLQEKHSALMKELKGTREQRISKFENSKQSFMALIKSLQEQDFRDEAGHQLELVKMATEKEAKRLSELHEYLNGEVDRPILSADSVKGDE